MQERKPQTVNTKVPESKPFVVRKLARSGHTRYLSVGTILPDHWDTVKVIVDHIDTDKCTLKLELIK